MPPTQSFVQVKWRDGHTIIARFWFLATLAIVSGAVTGFDALYGYGLRWPSAGFLLKASAGLVVFNILMWTVGANRRLLLNLIYCGSIAGIASVFLAFLLAISASIR